MLGQIVFCPRKTGSASIARSWTKSSGNPTIHTHDMKYLIVTDVNHSMFLKYIKRHLNKYLCFIDRIDAKHIEYTILPNEYIEKVFNYFTSFKIVTSIRHPLPRRISQFTQALTLDQINAVIDSHYVEDNIKYPKVNTSKKLDSKELCDILEPVCTKNRAGILHDVYLYMKKSERLINTDEVLELFKTNYIDRDTLEFTEFFNYMYNFVVPDFSFDNLLKSGHTTQIYKIFGKDVIHKLFKLEDLSDPKVFNIFKDFTGIKKLSRDHNSSECISLCDDSPKKIKAVILEKYKDVHLSKKGSLEYNITKGFGY